MELLALLFAKAGAATLTTKVVVAGAVSAATIGTAGATGVVPVEALLPGDSTSIVVEEDAGTDAPAEETPDPAGDANTDVAGPVEAPEGPATEDPVTEDPEAEDPALGDAPEDEGKSALDALDAARSKAPEQAHAGLDRARAAVTRAHEGDADATTGAAEQGARLTGQPQRPAAEAEQAVPRAGRGADQAPSAPGPRSGGTGGGNGAGRD